MTRSWWLVLIMAAGIPSCAPVPKPQWLMPTPRIYQNGAVDPFGHLPGTMKRTTLPVYYATNRKWAGNYYGFGMGPRLKFGVAQVGIGGAGTNWPVLAMASTAPERPEPLPLRLLDFANNGQDPARDDAAPWLAAVNRSLEGTETRDVMIYVHGAKVEFFHSCAFAAELGHFSGRDITPVAFDWATHPEVFAYVARIDLAHGIRSAERLAELVRLLAGKTSVRKIHLVSWSAGARVLSRALVALGGEDPGKLRARYRIGTTVFAAGDVPERDFIGRLPAIHALSERVLVYLSDDDGALRWSARLMGGGRRLGLAPESVTPEEAEILRRYPRLEIVDTSLGKQRRGFDITGHRYWYQHPWISSDLILAVRTDASPARRGLTASKVPRVWYFAPDYGERIGAVARTLTTGRW